MTDLEKALVGDNNDLNIYLENVNTRSFRQDIHNLIEKHQRVDVKELKDIIKAAVDAA